MITNSFNGFSGSLNNWITIACVVAGQHYAAEDVAQRRTLLLDRRGALLEKSGQRRVLLEDSFRLQQFERDCDETKGWINEKLKFATDDSYLDPTNLNGKVQKHQVQTNPNTSESYVP